MKKIDASFFHLLLRLHGLSKDQDNLRKLLRSEYHDTIHVHSNSVFYVDLWITKECGVLVRVAHVYAIGNRSGIKECLSICVGQMLNYHYAIAVIRHGVRAGDDIFGKLCT